MEDGDNMKCCCGHEQDHHNPARDALGIEDDFAGNCRNCKCPAFIRELPPPVCDQAPVVHGLIARRRGEYIVRRWNDEVEELKAAHEFELAQRDLMLEEQKRLMRIANMKLVELEYEIKKLKR